MLKIPITLRGVHLPVKTPPRRADLGREIGTGRVFLDRSCLSQCRRPASVPSASTSSLILRVLNPFSRVNIRPAAMSHPFHMVSHHQRTDSHLCGRTRGFVRHLRHLIYSQKGFPLAVRLLCHCTVPGPYHQDMFHLLSLNRRTRFPIVLLSCRRLLLLQRRQQNGNGR